MRSRSSISMAARPDHRGTDAGGEESYALALEAVGYGYYDWDVEAGTVSPPPTLGKMLGLSPRKAAALATSAGWANWIHPDDLPAYRQAVAASFKGETARFEIEYRYRSRDGSWRWARQHGALVRRP